MLSYLNLDIYRSLTLVSKTSSTQDSIENLDQHSYEPYGAAICNTLREIRVNHIDIFVAVSQEDRPRSQKPYVCRPEI